VFSVFVTDAVGREGRRAPDDRRSAPLLGRRPRLLRARVGRDRASSVVEGAPRRRQTRIARSTASTHRSKRRTRQPTTSTTDAKFAQNENTASPPHTRTPPRTLLNAAPTHRSLPSRSSAQLAAAAPAAPQWHCSPAHLAAAAAANVCGDHNTTTTVVCVFGARRLKRTLRDEDEDCGDSGGALTSRSHSSRRSASQPASQTAGALASNPADCGAGGRVFV
jgi:hypothetical protein